MSDERKVQEVAGRANGQAGTGRYGRVCPCWNGWFLRATVRLNGTCSVCGKDGWTRR
jgi:hypothetical protein